jgi:hypothetical protein
MMTSSVIFRACVEAILENHLIFRESNRDKEFHFQNWFQDRLEETGLNYERGGRNSYPDFRMVASAEGYELKGLAYPGRDASFDSNSQPPTGFHNGRTIYYVFGRYPRDSDGDYFPVLDLVMCHGDFLSANHEYVHKNRSLKGFGTYGDIMIRDRKMYVVPTPFHLFDGLAHHRTLILPVDDSPGEGFSEVGELTRVEATELIVGYSFDLRGNELVPEKQTNPRAGDIHCFRAWRLGNATEGPLSMKPTETVVAELSDGNSDDDV